MRAPWLGLSVGAAAPSRWVPLLQGEFGHGLNYAEPTGRESLAGSAPYVVSQVPFLRAELGATQEQLPLLLNAALGTPVAIPGGFRYMPAALPLVTATLGLRGGTWEIAGAGVQQFSVAANAEGAQAAVETQGGLFANVFTPEVVDEETTQLPFAGSTLAFDGQEYCVLDWGVSVQNTLLLTHGPDSLLVTQRPVRLGPPRVNLTFTLPRDVFDAWYALAAIPGTPHAAKIVAGAYTWWLPDVRVVSASEPRLARGVPAISVGCASGSALQAPLGFPAITEAPIIVDHIP